MKYAEILDSGYWCTVLLSSIGYAALSLHAYQFSKKKYMLVMSIISISIFATSLLSYMLRNRIVVPGNAQGIRNLLLLFPILRTPIDIWLYSLLLKDFKNLKEKSETPIIQRTINGAQP